MQFTRRVRHPVESTFATVRLHARVTKGWDHGMCMAYELINAPQARSAARRQRPAPLPSCVPCPA